MEEPNKLKQLIKSQGFYVALFICLCAVAVVAAVTLNSQTAEGNKNNTEAKVDISGENKLSAEGEKDNALFVKEDTKDIKPQIEIHKSGKSLAINENTTSVSSENVSFIKPIDGTIAQGYSEVPLLQIASGNENVKVYKTNFGLDIKSELGASVVASSEGTVELVGEDPKGYGNMVVLNHNNGYKTVYSNLDSEFIVKAGDEVKEGQEIGKVGNSTLRTLAQESLEGEEKIKNKVDYLHFSILEGSGDFIDLDKNNNYINPEKFIKY